MFDGLESTQAFADHGVVDAGRLGCQRRRHGVVHVVPAAESEFLEVDGALVFAVAHHDFVVPQEGALGNFSLLAEGQGLGLEHYLVQMGDGDGVVAVEDEAVLGTQVPGDAELALHVVLELVVVAVQMVRGDVGDNGDVGPEGIAAVELEAADFQHVVVVLLGCHLKGVALADVAAKAHVEACVLQQVVDERGGGGLAVGTGYADLFGVVVAPCELDFGDHRSALGDEFLNQRSAVGNARALHYLVGREHLALGVAALFVGDVPFAEHCRIFFLDLPVVGQENLKTFHFCEDRCANSAFGSSKYS